MAACRPICLLLAFATPAWVHTDGTVTLGAPAFGVGLAGLAGIPAASNAVVFAVAQGSYGFPPGAAWGRFGVSRIWTAVTEHGSRVVTWEGALEDRDTARRVSFQAEFGRDGSAAYRYAGFPEHATAGVFGGGAAQVLEPASNTTTILLSYIGLRRDGYLRFVFKRKENPTP